MINLGMADKLWELQVLDHNTGFGASGFEVDRLQFFVTFLIDLKIVDKTLETATPYSGVTEPPESVIPYCWRLNQS